MCVSALCLLAVILGNVRKAAETEKVMCKAIALAYGTFDFLAVALAGKFRTWRV